MSDDQEIQGYFHSEAAANQPGFTGTPDESNSSRDFEEFSQVASASASVSYSQARQYRDTPYVGGMCLKAVQDAFSPPDNFRKVNWAMDAWDMEVNSGAAQKNVPPKGVAVPIWFDLAGLNLARRQRGHIAISLPNGKVASASQAGKHSNLFIHNSINDLIKYYGQGIKYLGWSPWVEGVQIVKKS